MYVRVELHKLEAQNIVDMFITPNLSFYYDSESRIREKTSTKLSSEIREFLKSKEYVDRFGLVDLSVIEKKVGPVKSDIEIGVHSNDKKQLAESIEKLSDKIATIKGIKSYFSGLSYGTKEIKLKISPYGESLGVDEGYIGSILSNMYLGKKKATIFDKHDVLNINIESINKDSFEDFKNIEIPLKNGKMVFLEDICSFEFVDSFEQIIKNEGETNFYLYANVDSKIITSTEVLDILNPLINEIEQSGVNVKIKGEDEQKKELRSSMLSATIVAIFLIFLALIYLFNSIKDSLIVMSVIPFSILGVLIGHVIMGLNISMPSMIGALGLSGVVVNDGILMMTYLKKSKNMEDVYMYSARRLRPIMLTSITTLIGMASLIFFPTGQAAIFQPMAVSLGFGLVWGTVLNLIYLPVLFSLSNRIES
jgi:multidrug efflux pump subunit AcrB